jgi:hypothetical protein
MVRALALLNDGEDGLDLAAAVEGTGYHVTRSTDGEISLTTLPPGDLLDRVQALPAPPPTFPTTGIVGAEEYQAFASLRMDSGEVLILTSPVRREALRTLSLYLAGLGGIAGLLSMGFAIPKAPSPAENEETADNQ